MHPPDTPDTPDEKAQVPTADAPNAPDEQYFTKVGNRQISTRPYSVNGFLQHLMDRHGGKRNQWCSLDCATKAFGYRSTAENRKQAGQRMLRAYNELLERGILLLKDYGRHNRVLRTKLYNDASAEDRALANQQYERARKRGEITEAKLILLAKVMSSDSSCQRDSRQQSNQPPA